MHFCRLIHPGFNLEYMYFGQGEVLEIPDFRQGSGCFEQQKGIRNQDSGHLKRKTQ